MPWVTFAIIGLCLAIELFFQYADVPTQPQIADVDKAFRQVVELWTQHPELEAPENFDRGVELLSEDQQRVLWELPVVDGSADESAAQADLQEQLDVLWNRMLVTVPKDPRMAWGFRSTKPSLIQAFTHMFVHSDWNHVLWNMFYLFTCAVLLEDVWGRSWFLGFYLAAGLAALVPDIFFLGYTPGWSVGASGAVSGVMGAFAVRFWNVRMRLVLPLWLGARRIWVSSWLIVTLWFVEDVSLVPEQLAGGRVAHTAHVAGFLFGAAFALAFKYLHVEERYLAAAVASKSLRTIVSNPAIDRSMTDLGSNRNEIAWRRMMEAVWREPENVDAVLALWSVAREMGREVDTAEAMVRAIRVELRAGHVDNATDHWRELVDCVSQIAMDAVSLIRISEQLVRRGFRAEAAETLRRAFEHSARTATGATLLQLATLAEDLDLELSEAAARAALEHPDSNPRVKQASGDLLSRVRACQPTISG